MSISKPLKRSEQTLPVLALRDVVVFPFMVIPLFVGRTYSIRALEAAMEGDKRVFLVAQRDASLEEPQESDLYRMGTVANILQLLRLPDGTVKILVEGIRRAEMTLYRELDGYSEANIRPLYPEEKESANSEKREEPVEIRVLMRRVLLAFEHVVNLNKKIPSEVLNTISNLTVGERFSDSVAAHLSVDLADRQAILATLELPARLILIEEILQKEITLLEMEKRIQGRVKKQVEDNQRHYYLTERMKAIQNELGTLGGESTGGATSDELSQLRSRIEKAGMSPDAKEKALLEWGKLKMMPPMSAEATVVRNYLDCLLDLPWKQRSKINKDLKKAEETLNRDHYSLEKVKERILEYLAVQHRVEKMKGPILCLVGPPGVGKTSLGQSIANATGRKFVRISLGGVRDEAEIRGHRRTYIGAMPGKIIQKMGKVKVRNPLFMLDEIDKMAMDFRGDPASALLEVLDPEQNSTFNDHYLEVDYDLSDVMFIATANSLDNIPLPLLDRMEVIRLPGYTEDEKLKIAEQYLLPSQIKQAGLKESEVHVTVTTLRDIIRYYTREAGVRNLDREIAKICRKVVKQILLKAQKAIIQVTPRNLEKYLGVHRFRFDRAEEADQLGRVIGLAWTEVGGEILTLEAQIVPGTGKFIYTGRLGNVMQESIQAAMTVARSRAHSLGIRDEVFQKFDFHIHVPEGATPKDGPSAGIGMCTALVSALTHIPVSATVAMTGEITLRGEVLPIGGLKEKLLAALRSGIKTVIIPEENKSDLKELPKNIIESLKIIPVRWIDQVLEIALTRRPTPLLNQEVEIETLDLTVPVKRKGKRKTLRDRAH